MTKMIKFSLINPSWLISEVERLAFTRGLVGLHDGVSYASIIVETWLPSAVTPGGRWSLVGEAR